MEESLTFPMNGGDGAYSYAKNSYYQKLAIDSVKEKIQEAVIENLDTEEILSTTTLIRIADLGCSIGPNSFFSVQNLIQAVEHKFCGDSKNDLIEFQVFFNDHNGNDFNTLFASLPADRLYHAAGVPGSFHGRLFPRGSITIAHSCHAVHWLSKQPKLGVANEGRIHYVGAPEDVVRAYSDQFERDLGVFMSARADEIVSGGLMLLFMPGTPKDHIHTDGIPIPQLEIGVIFDLFASSLMDLVNQGVVEKKAVDAFNLPLYFPELGEMRKVIEKNGCFSIERLELTNPRSKLEQGQINVAGLINHIRAGLEGVFISHFGNSVVDKMFDNVSAKTEEISRYLELELLHNNSADQLFVVLKRK